MRTLIRSVLLAILLALPILAVAQARSLDRISPTDAPPTAPEGGFSCPNGELLLLNQQPNQSNGVFSDADCDACGGGAQAIAEDFVLLADTTVSQIVFWGGYFPGNMIPGAPGTFDVTFHQDTANLPGANIDSQSVVATSVTTTGVVLFGVNEVEIVLDLVSVVLPAGTYWVEITTNTAGSTDSFFWEVGNLDGVAGRFNDAFAFEVPGVNWLAGNPTADNAVALCGTGTPSEQARFLVTKNFDDDNPAEVEVTLSCNTGLPLMQTTMISEGDPVNFVIGDFEQGALNCEVSEVVPEGYTASYNGGTDCVYENIAGAQYNCDIDNFLDAVEVEVTKVWIDENPEYNAQNIADATWACSNVAFDDDQAEGTFGDSGLLSFFGNPGVDSFFVYPSWDGGTHCSVTEVFISDSGVEIDDSECDSVVVFPGSGGSCTIYNTRLYEGIPTLSHYGLALLALLMLGVGLVGFRRFV